MLKTAISFAVLPALLASTSAFAQQGNAAPQEKYAAAGEGVSDSLDTIVVTAQRRRESAQTVPIAVSAFSGSQLQTLGVTNTLQVTALVPNVVAQNNTGLGSAAGYYIRGIGNTESIPTFDAPVGTYVNDIYVARQSANNLALFDVERVEVLRGPQGTLFGRNTTGGAIHVIMKEPTDELTGYAEVAYGSYDKKMVRGSINIPLSQTFQAKVSAFWMDDDGYVKNTTTGDRLNDEDGWGVNAMLKGQLGDGITLTGSYTHIWSGAENYQNFECDPRNPTNCSGRFATTGYSRQEGTSRFDGLNISGRKARYGLGNDTATDIASLKLDVDLADKHKLNLISGYVRTSSQFSTDVFDGRASGTQVTGLPNTGSPSFQNPFPTVAGRERGSNTILTDSFAEQFSQEVKLVGEIGDNLINYVAGFFYFREDVRTDLADIVFNNLNADRVIRNSTDAKAAYAQLDFNASSQLTLTAGIRYTDETKRLALQDNRLTCAPAVCLATANLFAANGVAIPTKLNAKLWTPRFALNFKPSDDILLFASATRGFKSGGWNGRGTSNASFLPFGPEKVWSYEAGMKSEFFDRRLRFNVTYFHLDATDLQTQNAAISPTGALTFTTRNFANFKNDGLEVEMAVVPTRGLSLFAIGGYQDARYSLPKNAPASDIYGFSSVAALIDICRAAIAAGRLPTIVTPSPNGAACGNGIVNVNGELATPVRAPKWTLSLGSSYEMDLGGESGMTLVPAFNVSWRSDQQVGTNNVTVYLGQMTGVGTNGTTYTTPANPYGGQYVSGSLSPSVWLVNASLTLFGRDRNWSVAATCNNCFDQARITSSIANTQYLNLPRQWQLWFKKSF